MRYTEYLAAVKFSTTPRRRDSSIDPIAGSTNSFNLATGSSPALLARCGVARLPLFQLQHPATADRMSVHNSIYETFKSQQPTPVHLRRPVVQLDQKPKHSSAKRASRNENRDASGRGRALRLFGARARCCGRRRVLCRVGGGAFARGRCGSGSGWLARRSRGGGEEGHAEGEEGGELHVVGSGGGVVVGGGGKALMGR